MSLDCLRKPHGMASALRIFFTVAQNLKPEAASKVRYSSGARLA